MRIENLHECVLLRCIVYSKRHWILLKPLGKVQNAPENYPQKDAGVFVGWPLCRTGNHHPQHLQAVSGHRRLSSLGSREAPGTEGGETHR